MSNPRVLVCGGVDFKDKAKLYAELDKLNKPRLACIITSDSPGADTLADWWGWYRFRAVLKFRVDRAEYHKHKDLAVFALNTRMLVEGRADVVVAFKGGKCTQDLVAQAKGLGIRVVEVA